MTVGIRLIVVIHECTVGGSGRAGLSCEGTVRPTPLVVGLSCSRSEAAAADLQGLSASPSVPVTQHCQPSPLSLPDDT